MLPWHTDAPHAGTGLQRWPVRLKDAARLLSMLSHWIIHSEALFTADQRTLRANISAASHCTSSHYTTCGTRSLRKQRRRQTDQHAVCQSNTGRKTEMTEMKERGWWLSSIAVGCSCSIKPEMALSAAAPASRPARPSPCHRHPLMLRREGRRMGRRAGEGEGG